MAKKRKKRRKNRGLIGALIVLGALLVFMISFIIAYMVFSSRDAQQVNIDEDDGGATIRLSADGDAESSDIIAAFDENYSEDDLQELFTDSEGGANISTANSGSKSSTGSSGSSSGSKNSNSTGSSSTNSGSSSKNSSSDSGSSSKNSSSDS
ncbi:MAG: hypothetical protein J1F63_05945, partial [Oscillospiraceae bacterium]|nr:hypothetical protein [Oscillospiraceae bacterium]